MRIIAAACAALLLLAGCGTTRSDNRSAPDEKAGPAAAAGSWPDWPTYHGNRARSGYYPAMPTFTGKLDLVKKVALDGQVYGSPIVVGGKVIVATENNTVYALTVRGAQIWKHHLAPPSPPSEHGCGNITPKRGITGSPLYRKGLVHVVTETTGAKHDLVALKIGTGAVAWRRNVDLPGADPAAMQQRGALNTSGGRILVPFGGLAGDCGNYKGRVISVAADGAGGLYSYTVPTPREAGIWTPPGVTVDGNGWIYAAVGNGAAVQGDPYDKSDSVLRFDSRLKLNSYFAPANWAQENQVDLDLGTVGPALVGKWVFQGGKEGHAYVLNRSALGGIGGQHSSVGMCASFGGTAVVGDQVLVPCTDGVRRVTVTSSGQIVMRWKTSSGVSGSPVYAGRRVWTIDADGGVLHALNPTNGNSVAHISVGTTTRFATPAVYGKLLLVPTYAGITIVKAS